MSATIHTLHESSGDVERVLAILTSEQWPVRKAEALRDGSRVVERTERPDGGVLLVQSRELPGGGPGFLEKFLPQDGRVVQTDDWGPAQDGLRRGTWSVEIPGAPARLGGTLLLEPTATGSRYVIDGEAKVPIPLVGGKAERFIADMVLKLSDKEAELLRTVLTEPV
ncbi:MAG: hypothetical protein JWN08_2869 [Frankiales bacterium]|nr:hypothetical protein [Frankiales bacterium]